MPRGDIYLCDLGDPGGHEQGHRRPVVIVSREEMARFGIPMIVPVSRANKGYPTRIELESVLPVTSYIQCEHVMAVSSERLIRRVGAVDGIHMVKTELILRRILSLA